MRQGCNANISLPFNLKLLLSAHLAFSLIFFYFTQAAHPSKVLCGRHWRKNTKHSNTDLEVDYHGNGQSFETFGSTSLLFANDVVLLASSNYDLHQHWEVCSKVLITSKSASTIVWQKTTDWFLWVGNELLLQVKEVKYLGFLFIGVVKTETCGLVCYTGVAPDCREL